MFLGLKLHSMQEFRETFVEKLWFSSPNSRSAKMCTTVLDLFVFDLTLPPTDMQLQFLKNTKGKRKTIKSLFLVILLVLLKSAKWKIPLYHYCGSLYYCKSQLQLIYSWWITAFLVKSTTILSLCEQLVSVKGIWKEEQKCMCSLFHSWLLLFYAIYCKKPCNITHSGDIRYRKDGWKTNIHHMAIQKACDHLCLHKIL